MADVNANIGVNIDTSDALGQLKNLQRQISQFHSSVAKSSESAAQAQRNLQKNFLNSVNAIEGFSAELKTVRTTAESFSNSLEKNKLSMREYFRFAASQSKTFGKNFVSEFSIIEKTAIERVKTLQTQYIKMGRDANGAMQAIAIRPTTLNMKDLGTQTAITAQKQVIFNQLIKQGSTNLLNFGKNTQWAGRQLMVGFTLPLATLGMTAGRVFMDMEKAAIKFKKVYGDLFTAPGETEAAMESIVELGKQYTAYGVAVSDALSMAADAAAAGFAGADLQNQTAAALKLSVLGQLELNKALETTISLQNAFGISSADLAGEIDFLNAVENQTVISLDDMTTAVPKVAPVIKSLGGDVRDLAFFMAAMKEGGINASEGANALKSGLASLINPTDRARQMLSGFGVNLRGIINANEGDVTGVVVGFAKALDELDPLNRAQAIEQLFGKFQFARLSTLFANVAKDGTQASRVLDLAGSSVEELAALSEGELGVAAASSMNKFLAAVENIKLALAPIGETFLQIATPIIEFGTRMLEAFNNLPDGIKKSVATVITVIGGIGPIALMTFGLINNGIANMIKFFATVRLGYLRITGQAKGVGDETQYMTNEQLEAAAAAASLDQAHSNLTQRFTAEKIAVDALRASYEQAVAAGNRFALLNPGMMKPGSPAKFANGGFVSGSGTGDTVPAMLTPGEYVINKQAAEEMMPLLEAINSGQVKKFSQGGEVGQAEMAAAGAKAPTARSAALLVGFIQRDLGKVLATGNQALLDEFLKFVREFTANAESVTKTSLRAAIMQQETMARQYAPQRFQGEKTDFAHVGSAQKMTASQAAAGGVNIENSRLQSLVQNVSRIIPDLEMTFKSGFGVELSGKINNLMDKSGASIQAFLEDFDSRGLDKWRQAVEIGGGSFSELEPQLQAYNDSLRQKVQQALDNGATKIVDTQREIDDLRAQALSKGEVFDESMFVNLEQLSNETRAGLGEFGTKLNQVIDTALATITEVSLKMTQQQQELLAQNGVNIDFGQRSGGGFRGSGKVALARAEGGVGTFNDTLADTAQTASESKRTVKIAKDTADGYINELERQAPAIADAAVAVGEQAQAKSGPRRKTTDGNVIWDSQAKQYQEQAKMAEINVNRQRGLARATQATIDKISVFAGRASQASLAIGSVAGLATMFGGKLGEVASIIMQITFLFSALAAVTAKLVAAKSMESTMKMVEGLNAGRTAGNVVSDAGGWLGGAKGKAALDAFGKNIGAVARSIPGLGRVIGVLTTTVTIGGVALGSFFWWITAIIAVVTLGVIAYQKANEAINGLANASRASADEIKAMGELFGITAKTSNLSSQFTGGAQGDTSEERDATQMVLESEEYENNWKKKADAIRSASQADAQRSMEALALQLSASGFDSAAVEAIINAIVTDAGRTDLNLEFAKINVNSKEGLASITRIANESSAALQTSFEKFDFYDAAFGWLGGGQLNTQVQTSAAQFANLFDSLAIGFEEGNISAEDFNSQIENINSQISSLDPAAAKKLVDELAVDLELNDELKGLDNFEDKLLAINAATAGVEIPSKVVKALEKASKAGATKKDLQTAVRLRKEIVELIEDQTKAQEALRKEEELQELQTAAVEEARASISEQVTALQEQSTAYDILIEAGFGAAEAIDIVSDAAIAQGLAMATSAVERQRLLNDIIALKNLERETEKRTAAATGGGGGGGSKSPMQEALEDLGKQRTEIKNNINAYSGLRKAGFSAAQAAEAAGDATLAAALASTKVGSSQWKALVNQIRLVRIEALKTSEGLRNAFDGLKGQADEYYDILERQVERKYADGLKAAEKQATSLNRAIEDLTDVTDGYQEEIDGLQRDVEIQFDRPIEALNEETSDLANDLALMDREANKITERYDEQAEALDRVNKINQRIIAQQKQQVGLASALVEGDISAAAAAVQDIRAANAEAAGQSVGDMLNTAKQAEVDALRSESGMSRVEIEERQFEISQEIYDLEEQREAKLEAIRVIEDKIYKIQQTQIKPLEKQLKANEDMVQAIEDQRDAEIDAIDAQRQKWEDAELALDAARIEAGEFNNVIDMAKKLTGDVVTNWKELANKTVTLTIDTVMKEIGGAPTDAAIVKESGTGGGGGGQGPIPEAKEVPEPAVTEEEAKGPIQKAFDWLKEQGGNFGDWWNDLFGSIGTWLSEQWTAFTTWLTSLPGQIAALGTSIWSGIQSIPVWLGEQWENFKVWLSELPYNIGVGVGRIWGDIQDIGDWLATQWENFKTWATVTLPNGIKQWGADAWTNMQNVGAWLATQWEKFKTWATVTLPNGIKQWGANVWASIQDIPEWLATQWEKFKTWVTVTLPNGIKNWASNIWNVGLPSLGNWLVERAKELENWIKSIPGKIGNWAKNLWDGFWSGFKAGESQTRNKATGGMIYRNRGGDVPGQGNTDSVSAMLTPGEYVVNKRATAKFRPVLKAINAGTFGGGLDAMRYQAKAPAYSPSNLSSGVYNVPSTGMSTTPGSMVSTQQISSTQMDNSVYNYSLSVNVNGSNANADDIANNVISKIKRMDSQRLRKQVVG